MEVGKIRRLSGANQTGVRAYNERLLLSMLQRHGALPGSDIARRTGLSPQTASVILRKLESDGLVIRGETVRGKVGKPSVPMRLNPDGLYSLGLKIGRRSADLLLMNFAGEILVQKKLAYPYPMPDQVFGFLRDGLKATFAGLDRDARARVCGIGIAMPFELWGWHEQIGAPAESFGVWQRIDPHREVSAFSDLPVFVCNDATAACRAEHVFGRGKEFTDYAYFFLGAFAGGGVVLNHSVYEGRSGNAGAMGPLPSLRPDGTPGKLIDTASLYTLEAQLSAAGIAPGELWKTPQDWSGLAAQVDPWMKDAARALAAASLATCAVIDFEAILIDGAMPPDIRRRLVRGVRRSLTGMDARGLVVPAIEEGRIGANARAIGAACGPVISQYLLNSDSGVSSPLQAGQMH